MKMSRGLLHRSRSSALDSTAYTATGFAPPPPAAPDDADRPRWPNSAKVLVALLLVATVVATIAAVVGAAARDEDAATARSLRAEIAALTAARDEANSDVESLDAELAAVQEQLAAVEAENDGLEAAAVGRDAQIADLTERAAELDDRIATVTEARDAAAAKAEQLEAALVTERERIVEVSAERDALAALFPMTFDTPFGADSAVGVYDVTTSRVYCAGLATCATAPALADLTIVKATGNNTRFSIPGFAAGDMFWADGAFHAVVDSTTVLPACDGVARTGRMWMTIFPGTLEIERDRAPGVVDLQGVISIEAPPIGNCSGVLAFYSIGLSPHA